MCRMKNELLRKESIMTLEALTLRSSHLMSRHIEMTNEELIGRIIEARENGLKMEASTSFRDEKSALDFIKRTILNDEGECSNLDFISSWLSDTSDFEPLDVEMTFDEPVGYGYLNNATHEWANGPKDFFTCRVCLEKLDNYRGYFNFVIKTAYPI